jgi:Tfp pilus assembly protein PilO
MSKNFFNNADYKIKLLTHVSISVVAFALVLYFGIISPAAKIIKIKNNINSAKANLENNYITGANLRVLSESLKTVEPQLDKVNGIFVKKDEALDFITAVEGVADVAGVSQKINLSAAGRNTSKTKTNESITISLSSSGSFSKEMDYLTKLESLNYYINIKSLEMVNNSYEQSPQISGESISSKQISMQIAAETYWQN